MMYKDRAFWDVSVTQGPGQFAAEYFRIRCDDPAKSFLEAKWALYAAGDPAAQNFLYLGLPEKNDGTFGKYKPVTRLDHPKPQPIPTPDLPEACPSGNPNDCDGDGLSEDTEHYLASSYAPYLVPDEDEDQLPIHHSQGQDPFGVFWQVSPAVLEGRKGVWITYVFAYTSDNGAHDFDIDFVDCAMCLAGTAIDYCDCSWKNPWCCLAKVITFPIGASIALNTTGPACTAIEIGIDRLSDFGVNYNTMHLLSFHPGDNEGFRVFVEELSDGWRLTHINWKRHHEGFDYEGHLQTVAEAEADGLEFEDTHPVLYVSEDKHAMYPSHDACEGYEMHLSEKLRDECRISFEHCSGHPIYNRQNPIKTMILKELNVGEEIRVQRMTSGPKPVTFHLFEDMGPVFPGENVWETREGTYFCGSLWIDSPGWIEPGPCGGPMGKLWYAGPPPLDIE